MRQSKSVTEQLAGLENRCIEQIKLLEKECVLAEALTGAPNALSKKVKDAIGWTQEVHAFCEEYKGVNSHTDLYPQATALLQTYLSEFNRIAWNEASTPLDHAGENQLFAGKVDDRKHDIINALSVHAFLQILRDSLKAEKPVSLTQR